jgi:oligopeptide transport system permease protein
MTAAGKSPWALVWRRFRRNRRAMVCAALLGMISAGIVLVPILSKHKYDHGTVEHSDRAPCAEYWFGTDDQGRDLLVRSFYGGRISVAVGLCATAISLLIGVVYGSLSAFAGGKVDLVMMRFVDVLYGLPYMLVVVIAMVILGRTFLVVFLVLGAFSWLTLSRIVRGQVLSLKEREFVEAARALGAPAPGILWRHLIPNVIGPVVVYTTLTIPAVMLQESFISFLGLGISAPETSWGMLLDDGRNALFLPTRIYWWKVVFPGAMLAATLYCLNSIGDGLRDAFDIQAERSP